MTSNTAQYIFLIPLGLEGYSEEAIRSIFIGMQQDYQEEAAK